MAWYDLLFNYSGFAVSDPFQFFTDEYAWLFLIEYQALHIKSIEINWIARYYSLSPEKIYVCYQLVAWLKSLVILE